jgi:hypothetical protein
MVCTGWILDTNDGYQPVQMPVFPVESRAFVLPTVGGTNHDAKASMSFVLEQVSGVMGVVALYIYRVGRSFPIRKSYYKSKSISTPCFNSDTGGTVGHTPRVLMQGRKKTNSY